MLTDNVAFCDRRWLMQILIAFVLLVSPVPIPLDGFYSALAVLRVALRSVVLTFPTS